MSAPPFAPADRRIAVATTLLCLLATAAAVLSFVKGSWLGIVWVLLAGLTSNMAWYYLRRARAARPDGADGADVGDPAGR